MTTMTSKNQSRVLRLGMIVLKLVGVLFFLYFFICSLDLLASSFRLLAGKDTGSVFAQSDILKNPVVGVMIGVLATVAVQSSSTTTSIIVGLVAANILNVQQALPMVMGANIGTSVTNTIVSITEIGNVEEFRRAFSCAVVHDIFNWLSVIVLLFVEVITGYLYHLTSAIVNSIPEPKPGKKPPQLLKGLTKPFTKVVVQLDKKILEGWSTNDEKYANVSSLLKECHEKVVEPRAPGVQQDAEEKLQVVSCGYLFENFDLGDTGSGVILLFASLFILSFCLIMIVKILNSLMEEKAAQVIKRALHTSNSSEHWLRSYLMGYFSIVVGAVITFLVQSSSVFTSTITPLVGIDLFPLESAYPLTLGSNIGTTTTGLLAALAVDGSRIKHSLQIALCHLFFNISGILLFYPIPFMRWPLPLARRMGDMTAKYRWFALFYLVIMFFLLPLYVFGLSLIQTSSGAPLGLYIGFLPLAVLLILVVLINVVQENRPEWLPGILQTWEFLPEPMRSLAPYDRFVQKLVCCKKFSVKSDDTASPEKEGQDNKAMEMESV